MAGLIPVQSVLDAFGDLDWSDGGSDDDFKNDADLAEFEEEEAKAKSEEAAKTSSEKSPKKSSAKDAVEKDNAEKAHRQKIDAMMVQNQGFQEVPLAPSALLDFAASGVKEMLYAAQDQTAIVTGLVQEAMTPKHKSDHRKDFNAGYGGIPVCSAFQKGICRDGMNCRFVHEGAFKSGGTGKEPIKKHEDKDVGEPKGVFDPETYIRTRLMNTEVSREPVANDFMAPQATHLDTWW